MYAEWSSLTVQLQTLGTATQSVLAKLPPEDGKQVRRSDHSDSVDTDQDNVSGCWISGAHSGSEPGHHSSSRG